MSAPPRGTSADDSKVRGHRRGLPEGSKGVLAAGLAGAALLAAAELTPVLQVVVGGSVVDRVAGHDRHSWAFLVLALGAAAMAVGAGRGGSRPAAAALAGIGAVALAIVLAGDLPDVSATGSFGARYSDASAEPRIGFWLELAGGALLLSAGLAGLLRGTRRAPQGRRAGRRPSRRAAADIAREPPGGTP